MMPTYTLALDPGYKKTGIAIFQHTRLIYGGLIEIKNPDRDLVRHWQNQRDAIERILIRKCGAPRILIVAAEIMQVDRRTKKAQMQSLLELQGLVGIVAGLATEGAHGYPPSTWNKNRSKGPNHARIIRRLEEFEKVDLISKSEKITDGDRKSLFASLSPAISVDTLYDRAVAEKTGQAEHVLDAVGIGLYHMGRL